MTKDKDLKRLARERSQKTGEAYSTARRQLVAKETVPERPGSEAANELTTPWLGLDEVAMAAAPLAHDEARVAGHPWVEPEHLMLGLLSHGGVLPALRAMRVSPVAIRHHVERSLPAKRDARVNPTLSGGFLWALGLGREEAHLRGAERASPYDILIALSRLDRPVRDVLDDFGAGEAKLREHLGCTPPPLESRVRAGMVNRLLPLLGQSAVSMGSLVHEVRLEEVGERLVVSVVSGEAALLLRFSVDLHAAVEAVVGRPTGFNVIAATGADR